MNEEGPERQRDTHGLVKAIANSGKGLVIFVIGLFFLVSGKMGIAFSIDERFRYFFSGICLLYGGWRIYRGYKQE